MKRLAAALLLVASLAHAQGWGWTPGTTAVPVPPSAVVARAGTALQALVDSLPAAGGTIQLDVGRFYANASDSTIPLTLTKPVAIVGQSFSGTYMASPILVETGDCRLENFYVDPAGGAYGVKLFRDDGVFPGGGGVPRCTLRNLFIGALDTTSRNAGQGPVVGLYLDGAILTTIDHCTIGFCTHSGIYINSSQGGDGWSTNANVFYNCTSNLSGHYGMEVVGGAIEGTQYLGGNMEDNTWGAVFSQSASNITFRGVDFESTVFPIAEVLNIITSSPSTVEDCNFNTSGAGLAFIFQTCINASVLRCRFTTFSAYSSCGAYDDRCSDGRESGNFFNTGGYIDNRQTNSHPAMDGTFQPNLRSFYGVLWGASLTPTAATFGNVWTNTGSVTQPTPSSSHLSGWLRRTVFSGTAAAETGIKQGASASDFQFWAGDSVGTGGFYFSATFRLDAIPATANRLFVGLVASGTTAPASVADSSSLNGDAIGLYHDAHDVNVFRVVAVKGGTATKFVLNNGATAPQYDNGQGYRFEMIQYPNANAIQCRLYSLNQYGTLAGYATLTNSITKTVLFAPQVEVGSAANTYSLGIANVTVQVAR